jgi:hypothetical protein
MFFGSVLAFFLLLSPRLVSAFRNTLQWVSSLQQAVVVRAVFLVWMLWG